MSSGVENAAGFFEKPAEVDGTKVDVPLEIIDFLEADEATAKDVADRALDRGAHKVMLVRIPGSCSWEMTL